MSSSEWMKKWFTGYDNEEVISVFLEKCDYIMGMESGYNRLRRDWEVSKCILLVWTTQEAGLWTGVWE